MSYSTGYATLATNSAALEGYPSAALVGYTLDAEGLPVFCFSAMSRQCAESGPPTRAALLPRTQPANPGRLGRTPPGPAAPTGPHGTLTPTLTVTQVDPHQGPYGGGAHVHRGRQGGALPDEP